MQEIEINNYIEGFEYYGETIKKVKGWVDRINSDGNTFEIQADDYWDGARGTMILSELGEVIKLKDEPRPTKWQ